MKRRSTVGAAALEEVARSTPLVPVSAAAYERAAEVSTGAERHRLAVAAAHAWHLAGRSDRALAVLERWAGRGADAAHARGRALTWSRPAVAYAVLVAVRPPSAAVLADAAVAAHQCLHEDDARTAARQADELEPTPLHAMLVAALQRRDVEVPEVGSIAPERAPLVVAGPITLLLRAGEVDRAQVLLDRLHADAARRDARGVLADLLQARAAVHLRAERWREARGDAAAGLRIAEETGQPAVACHLEAQLALLAAHAGDEPACRAHNERAEHAARVSGVGDRRPWHPSLGLLELALGRPARALEHGISGPLAVEAALQAGRRDAAEAALARYAAAAEEDGGPAALALLARCRGLLAEDDAFEREFAEALGRHGQDDGGFARARTELSLGERRRRAGRRRQARPVLRSALATFERLGADAWADRARLELEATGERLPLDTPGLTAQERRVAAAVAAGATNREAAAALHLSPRTVEYHLRKVFRKLGVRSRTELSRALAAGRPD